MFNFELINFIFQKWSLWRKHERFTS